MEEGHVDQSLTSRNTMLIVSSEDFMPMHMVTRKLLPITCPLFINRTNLFFNKAGRRTCVGLLEMLDLRRIFAARGAQETNMKNEIF